MELVIDLNDMEHCTFDNQEVKNLYLNDQLIWADEMFILNVTTGTSPSGSAQPEILSFSISTVGGCSVTFDGETIDVPANSSQAVSFYRDIETTGDLVIKGDIDGF